MKGLSLGKKKEVGTTSGSSGAAKAQGTPLWVYFMPSLVVAVLVVLVLSAMTLQMMGQARDEVNIKGAHIVSEALATRLSGLLAAKEDQLRILTGNEQLQQALAQRDPEIVQQAAAKAARLIPEVIQLRLYAFDDNIDIKPDPEGAAPMGYAGVDMINRAFKGAVPPAEVHQISAGAPYLAMAVPVTTEGRVSGALFSAWPISLITQVTDHAPQFDGEFQLVQGGDGGHVVAGSGPTEPLVTKDGAVTVDGSIWRVFYMHEEGAGSDFTLLAGLAGGGLLAMGLALFLQIRMFNRDMRHDMTTVVNLGESIISGKVGGDQSARVAATRDAILLLREYAFNSRKQQRQQAGVVPVAADEAASVGSTGPSEALQLDDIEISPSICRAYDVRGVVGETLSPEVAFVLGQAFAEEAIKNSIEQVCVAHDARLSSPQLYQAFSEGLVAQGVNVLQLGQAPVALPYYYMHTTPNSAAVMVTGSHNPPEYNGFKFYLEATPLHGDQLQALCDRAGRGGFVAGQKGRVEQRDLLDTYLNAVAEQTQIGRQLKVVVDGGNGVAGELACDLLMALGCEVVPLFCEPDGSFPNHHPDPSQRDNLSALELEVQAQEADLGIAFDGDGDRLAVIDNTGGYVWPEHLLMLLSADILQRHPGTDVVFDVKSSRHLAAFVLANGGRPIMGRSGHTRMKEKMRETGALLGGEFSGHFFIKERWYGSDDAVYAAVRLLEVLATDPRPLEQVVSELPHSPATPEFQLPIDEGDAEPMMQRILADANFGDARLVTLDGLRVEFTNGWGLVRASNTTPSLTFRFEADSEGALEEIQQKFRDLMTQVLPTAQLPF